jgi:adenosylmethionine---8-amino-7-oxononanoate aminotransferase
MRQPPDRAAIVRADKAHVWHPYTPMDAYIATADPLVIARASGVRLHDVNGRSYLDGNSSWWTASLGHGHPRLLAALERQARELAHCSLAGTTHEPAALLAEELCDVAPHGLSRVFYTDNGSTAIEVAVKMCVQMWRQLGAPKKSRFVALDGAYHGDSIGAASLGGVEIFRRPFAGVLFECAHAPFPEEGAYARAFDAIHTLLRDKKDEIAAVVVEPLVQGAAGMRVYDPAYLRELRAVCDANDVLLVVDEVFAGYGRTGKMWASEHAGITPDLMCIGKAFSSLFPMAATLTTERVFDAFRGDKDRALYYGHTFCGNPLGAAVAREVLSVYADEGIVERAARLAPRITAAFEKLREVPGVARVRSLGMIGAADLGGASGYLGGLGWRVYEEGLRRGAYLRPMGDTVYVCPPLVISDADLDELLAIFDESVRAALAAS